MNAILPEIDIHQSRLHGEAWEITIKVKGKKHGDKLYSDRLLDKNELKVLFFNTWKELGFNPEGAVT